MPEQKLLEIGSTTDLRIDQKLLVKDLVKDEHWVTWKVLRESFANRVRESNLFFSRKTATERLRD